MPCVKVSCRGWKGDCPCSLRWTQGEVRGLAPSLERTGLHSFFHPRNMAHLLLIDDEAPIRKSLREILEYEGHEVIEASTGMEGVVLATKKPFDGIFCDVKMPQMDGLDVLDMLAKKKVAAPVVMISGHGTVETAVSALKKGAYDFIQKPLDLNRVLVTLRNMLEREALVETCLLYTSPSPRDS